MRVKTDEIETTKLNQLKEKEFILSKINKIDKSLVKLTKSKREKIQIKKIIDKKETLQHTNEIQKIIRTY